MALPDVIEVVPWSPPSRAEVTVPGSKSITNRALALAALADGATTLRGALWSEDTQVMVDCLQRLDRKSTRLNSSHGYISYAVFCLKKKKKPSRYSIFHEADVNTLGNY